MEGKPWQEDDQQGGEHIPSGTSSLLPVQL